MSRPIVYNGLNFENTLTITLNIFLNFENKKAARGRRFRLCIRPEGVWLYPADRPRLTLLYWIHAVS